jgi:hypothetical protein
MAACSAARSASGSPNLKTAADSLGPGAAAALHIERDGMQM